MKNKEERVLSFMKKGDIGEGTIEKVLFPNKGILYTQDGERVIVKNGLPGQKIRFSIHKKRKGKCEGRLLEVLERSPVELEKPYCVHFGDCGGCAYQNIRYEEQLKLKEKQVLELLVPVVKTGQEKIVQGVSKPGWFEGIKPSPRQFAYRNKMEFSFGDEYKDGPLALGMHKRGSFYDLVTVDRCRIVDADFNQILESTLAFFSKMGVCYFKKKSHIGYLRHLLVRKAARTGEILIDLVTTTQSCGNMAEPDLLEGFCSTLRQLDLQGCIVGILHTKNDSIADAVKDEGTKILYGKGYFFEELLGLKFKISPFSFFQTNSLAAEVLYDTVREFVGKPDNGRSNVIYDLYSGTGTIAQMMAPVAQKVIGVEIVPEAVEAARENAEWNGLENCEFIAGDVWKVLDTIKERPDLIIMDPPREGIHPKALERIVRYGVERLVYISCKPTSLVKDLEVLQAGGYVVERCCCIDQFPGTMHVETVILLSQQKADDAIEVDLDLDELDLTSAETKATYQKIKEYVLKEYGLKVSSLYISQTKRKYGLDVRENYNHSKKENPKVPRCTSEKEEAILAALKYFAMI